MESISKPPSKGRGKVGWRLAHLVEMAMIAHDIESLDDIGVLERGADAKLRRDLFVVLLF